jgi:cytochrome c2
MIKLSLALAVIGVVLLIVSALPVQPSVSVASAPPLAAAPTAAGPTAAPTAAPMAAASDEVAYGKALFMAKGCATCHRHAAVSSSGFGPESGIPDLTTFRWTADYLRTWLKDPAAVKPATEMPNLGLKRDEIEALIAFLSSK